MEVILIISIGESPKEITMGREDRRTGVINSAKSDVTGVHLVMQDLVSNSSTCSMASAFTGGAVINNWQLRL